MVVFAIYILLIPILMIVFHLNKKSKGDPELNSNVPKVGLSQLRNDNTIMYPKKVGAGNDEEEIQGGKLARVDQNQDYENNNNVQVHMNTNIRDVNVSSEELNSYCSRFCYNIQNGLYSSIARKELLYSPRYKDLTHLMFYHFFSLLVLTILFNFQGDLNTALDKVKFNETVYLWFIATTIAVSNVFMMIIYVLYSSTSITKKELSTSDAVFKEVFKSCKTKTLIKSILLLLFNLGMFGFLFYGLTGFVMVWETYDHVILVCFVLTIVCDFILYDIILNLFYSCFSKVKSDENLSCCAKIFCFIRSFRCSD